MFQRVSRNEIADRVKHIRDLHRQVRPNSKSEVIAYELREQKTKDLLSNLQRMAIHPTLQLAFEFGRLNSMNTDSAHGLFGYHLDAIRDFDIRINSGRTHIVESHVFRRDLPVELPLELAQLEDVGKIVSLGDIISRWQEDVPIRVLDRPTWKRPGTYYVHVGTEDSLGSNLPPGSIAQVQVVGQDEAQHPNPRAIYLLQFPNGYRCSRCVITRGRLHVIASDRSHHTTETFAHPLGVRIVGRIHAYAMRLPVPEYPMRVSLSHFPGTAPLILPWEQPTRHDLLATKYKRFVRSRAERQTVHTTISQALGSTLSERSKRRYRTADRSEPHIDAMIHMTLEQMARYTDALRSGGFVLRGSARFSLDALLNAKYFDELTTAQSATMPFPSERWEDRRSKIGEWPAIASLLLPKPSLGSDRFLRINAELEVQGLHPDIGKGSWLALEDAAHPIDWQSDRAKLGWARSLYALQSGSDYLIGRLERRGADMHLVSDSKTVPRRLGTNDLSRLRRVCGAVLPI